MLIPVNLIAVDDPKELKFSLSPQNLRAEKKHVYILTDHPNLFQKDFINQTDGIINDISQLNHNISDCAFYIYFSRGGYALPFLKHIINGGGNFISPDYYRRINFWENNLYSIEVYNHITTILEAQPKGSINELFAIMQAIDATRHIEGDYLEIGVFSGSSALAALAYMQNIGLRRKCFLLDTYYGFSYEDSKLSPDRNMAALLAKAARESTHAANHASPRGYFQAHITV